MNIFALSLDPHECAEWHVDKHVVKMILEYCQLLCTAHHILDETTADLYRKTHVNHPCAKWVRESLQNYMWLVRLFECLLEEYTFRYNKIHASSRLLKFLKVPPDNISLRPMTPFALAMPDEYKGPSTIESYREYYRHGKIHLHTWKRRNIPCFIIHECV